MGLPQEKDQRKHRLLIKKEVLINNAVKGYILDLNEGGLFIYSQTPLPQGRVISLQFSLFEGEPSVEAQGIVRYVQENTGMGVMFTKLAPREAEQIKRFILLILAANPSGVETSSQDTRKKVLIVDDSLSARNIYKSRLVLLGFVVREAPGGIEAVKMLGRERPDIIVLDLMMEGMDGAKFLQLLRTNNEWKDIKVIVLSGRITPQEAEKISAFGISGLLPKMTTTPNKLADHVKAVAEGNY